MRTKEELIAKRAEYMPYNDAVLVQKELIEIYQKEYIPKHTKAEYYDLIIDNKVGEITERNVQDTNWSDRVFGCFSVISQRVRGFTKEHCLDLIFEAVQRQKDHIALWETLPTLEELVASDIEILQDSEYQTKIPNHFIRTDIGDDIIEMRTIGLSNWRAREYEKFTPQWRKDAEIKFILGK